MIFSAIVPASQSRIKNKYKAESKLKDVRSYELNTQVQVTKQVKNTCSLEFNMEIYFLYRLLLAFNIIYMYIVLKSGWLNSLSP